MDSRGTWDAWRRLALDAVPDLVGARSAAEITADASYLTLGIPGELFAELAATASA